jgi:SAM-dependent methyltransferase
MEKAMTQALADPSRLTGLDRYLQRRRIAMASRYIWSGARVLDIGSYDGDLFAVLSFLRDGVGVDPDADPSRQLPNATLVRGYFPEALPVGDARFEVITMLAVLEHIPLEKQPSLARDCWAHLHPGGRVIITVPSPSVDKILVVLTALRLVKGMALEQHYGYDVTQTEALFEAAGFRLLKRQRFQLGLNNLFVFERAV